MSPGLDWSRFHMVLFLNVNNVAVAVSKEADCHLPTLRAPTGSTLYLPSWLVSPCHSPYLNLIPTNQPTTQGQSIPQVMCQHKPVSATREKSQLPRNISACIHLSTLWTKATLATLRNSDGYKWNHTAFELCSVLYRLSLSHIPLHPPGCFAQRVSESPTTREPLYPHGQSAGIYCCTLPSE